MLQEIRPWINEPKPKCPAPAKTKKASRRDAEVEALREAIFDYQVACAGLFGIIAMIASILYAMYRAGLIIH